MDINHGTPKGTQNPFQGTGRPAECPGIIRDGTSHCPFVPGQKCFLVPLSLCPGTKKVSLSVPLSRDKITFSKITKKNGKGRSKTGKGRSKTGKVVEKQEKDVLKQKKCSKTGNHREKIVIVPRPVLDFDRKILIVPSRIPSRILIGFPGLSRPIAKF